MNYRLAGDILLFTEGSEKVMGYVYAFYFKDASRFVMDLEHKYGECLSKENEEDELVYYWMGLYVRIEVAIPYDKTSNTFVVVVHARKD